MLAIAMPKGGDQFRVLLTSLGMEPLLELVEDQQHLLLGAAGRDPFADRRQRIDQPQSLRASSGHALRKPLSSRCFGLLGGRLDVDRQDVLPSRGSSPALTSDDLPQPEGP